MGNKFQEIKPIWSIFCKQDKFGCRPSPPKDESNNVFKRKAKKDKLYGDKINKTWVSNKIVYGC